MMLYNRAGISLLVSSLVEEKGVFYTESEYPHASVEEGSAEGLLVLRVDCHSSLLYHVASAG